MEVEVRLWRYFLAVADDLHFGRAAQRLYITQPALSHGVRRLEEQLGTRLFDRSSRNVTLTPAGAALVPEARALVAAADRADAAARRVRDAAQERPLRIATVQGADVLNTAYADAMAAGQLLDFAGLTSDEQADALLRGEIDLGVGRVAPLPEGIDARLARVDPQLALCLPGSDLAGLSAVPLSTCVVGGKGQEESAGRYRSWARYCAAIEELGVERLRTDVGLPAQSQITARSLAERGRALLVIEAYVPAFLPYGFVVRPIAGRQPYYSWSLLTRAGDQRPDVRAFVDRALRIVHAAGQPAFDPTLPGEPWWPADDPHAADLGRLLERWRRDVASGA